METKKNILGQIMLRFKIEDVFTLFNSLIERGNINKDNFFTYSICNWEKTDKIDFVPDYTSYSDYDYKKTGSYYQFTERGVYRKSDHWGSVGTCFWFLNGRTKREEIGYANYEDFFVYFLSEWIYHIPKNIKVWNYKQTNRLWERVLIYDEYAPSIWFEYCMKDETKKILTELKLLPLTCRLAP